MVDTADSIDDDVDFGWAYVDNWATDVEVAGDNIEVAEVVVVADVESYIEDTAWSDTLWLSFLAWFFLFGTAATGKLPPLDGWIAPWCMELGSLLAVICSDVLVEIWDTVLGTVVQAAFCLGVLVVVTPHALSGPLYNPEVYARGHGTGTVFAGLHRAGTAFSMVYNDYVACARLGHIGYRLWSAWPPGACWDWLDSLVHGLVLYVGLGLAARLAGVMMGYKYDEETRQLRRQHPRLFAMIIPMRTIVALVCLAFLTDEFHGTWPRWLCLWPAHASDAAARAAPLRVTLRGLSLQLAMLANAAVWDKGLPCEKVSEGSSHVFAAFAGLRAALLLLGALSWSPGAARDLSALAVLCATTAVLFLVSHVQDQLRGEMLENRRFERVLSARMQRGLAGALAAVPLLVQLAPVAPAWSAEGLAACATHVPSLLLVLLGSVLQLDFYAGVHHEGSTSTVIALEETARASRAVAAPRRPAFVGRWDVARDRRELILCTALAALCPASSTPPSLALMALSALVLVCIFAVTQLSEKWLFVAGGLLFVAWCPLPFTLVGYGNPFDSEYVQSVPCIALSLATIAAYRLTMRSHYWLVQLADGALPNPYLALDAQQPPEAQQAPPQWWALHAYGRAPHELPPRRVVRELRVACALYAASALVLTLSVCVVFALGHPLMCAASLLTAWLYANTRLATATLSGLAWGGTVTERPEEQLEARPAYSQSLFGLSSLLFIQRIHERDATRLRRPLFLAAAVQLAPLLCVCDGLWAGGSAPGAGLRAGLSCVLALWLLTATRSRAGLRVHEQAPPRRIPEGFASGPAHSYEAVPLNALYCCDLLSAVRVLGLLVLLCWAQRFHASRDDACLTAARGAVDAARALLDAVLSLDAAAAWTAVPAAWRVPSDALLTLTSTPALAWLASPPVVTLLSLALLARVAENVWPISAPNAPALCFGVVQLAVASGACGAALWLTPAPAASPPWSCALELRPVLELLGALCPVAACGLLYQHYKATRALPATRAGLWLSFAGLSHAATTAQTALDSSLWRALPLGVALCTIYHLEHEPLALRRSAARWLSHARLATPRTLLITPHVVHLLADVWLDAHSDLRVLADAACCALVLSSSLALACALQPSWRRQDDKAAADDGAQRADADSDDGDGHGLCCVCQDEPVAVRFSCGHAVCCLECSTALQSGTESRPAQGCPVCRASFVTIDKGAHIASQPSWRPPPSGFATVMLCLAVLCACVLCDCGALVDAVRPLMAPPGNATDADANATPAGDHAEGHGAAEAAGAAVSAAAYSVSERLVAAVVPECACSFVAACLASLAQRWALGPSATHPGGVPYVVGCALKNSGLDAGTLLALVALLPPEPSYTLCVLLPAAAAAALLVLLIGLVDTAEHLSLCDSCGVLPRALSAPRAMCALGSAMVSYALLVGWVLRLPDVAAWPVVGVTFGGALISYVIALMPDNAREVYDHDEAPRFTQIHRQGFEGRIWWMLIFVLILTPLPMCRFARIAAQHPDSYAHWALALLTSVGLRDDTWLDGSAAATLLAWCARLAALGAVGVLALAMHMRARAAALAKLTIFVPLVPGVAMLIAADAPTLAALVAAAPAHRVCGYSALAVALLALLLALWLLHAAFVKAQALRKAESVQWQTKVAKLRRHTDRTIASLRAAVVKRDREAVRLRERLQEAEDYAEVQMLPPLFPEESDRAATASRFDFVFGFGSSSASDATAQGASNIFGGSSSSSADAAAPFGTGAAAGFAAARGQPPSDSSRHPAEGEEVEGPCRGGQFGTSVAAAPYRSTLSHDAWVPTHGRAAPPANYVAISRMAEYQHKSFEELRYEDWCLQRGTSSQVGEAAASSTAPASVEHAAERNRAQPAGRRSQAEVRRDGDAPLAHRRPSAAHMRQLAAEHHNQPLRQPHERHAHEYMARERRAAAEAAALVDQTRVRAEQAAATAAAPSTAAPSVAAPETAAPAAAAPENDAGSEVSDASPEAAGRALRALQDATTSATLRAALIEALPLRDQSTSLAHEILQAQARLRRLKRARVWSAG